MQFMQILFTVQRFNYSTQNGFQRVDVEQEGKGPGQIYNCNRIECANRNGNIKIEKNVAANDARAKRKKAFSVFFFFC